MSLKSKKIRLTIIMDNYVQSPGLIAEHGWSILIEVTGCAHRGLISTIRQAWKLSGKDNFLVVIGGFHLANKKQDYIDSTITELEKTSIERIIPSHCSGIEGYCEIKKVFGSRCEYGYAGKEIII